MNTLKSFQIKDDCKKYYSRENYVGFIIDEDSRHISLKYFRYNKLVDSVVFGATETLRKNHIASILDVSAEVSFLPSA